MNTIAFIGEALEKTLRAGAEEAEIFAVETSGLSVSCRMGKPEAVEKSESAGFGLRAFVNGRVALVSSSDFSAASLARLAELAVSMAKAAPPDPFALLAGKPSQAASIPDLEIYDGTEIPQETLMRAALEAEEAALATSGITNSDGADASHGLKTVTLGTSKGFLQAYKSSGCSVSVSAIAGTGEGMQRDYDYSSKRFWADLDSPSAVGKSAAARALAKLHPGRLGTAAMPVIFERRVARQLLSEFAHAISGSMIARKTSFLKNRLNERVFGEGVAILDDPFIKRGEGSRPFDAEGVSGKKREIVTNGVLLSWLLDLGTARQLGLETTGHAGRGIGCSPSPSPSNFYMQNGESTLSGLMKDIGLGLLITEAFGGGANSITGDFSQGVAGFLIENGEAGRPVSEITVAGNMTGMFASAVPANDLEFRGRINSPSLLIEGLTVAGT